MKNIGFSGSNCVIGIRFESRPSATIYGTVIAEDFARLIAANEELGWGSASEHWGIACCDWDGDSDFGDGYWGGDDRERSDEEKS